MAMSTAGAGDGVASSPNVTPMIDVMLVLLIIFMIVTPLINAGFQAEPPIGINLKSHPEENEDQVLGIDAGGQYYLNKKPIKNETLAAQLKTIFDTRTSDKILYVKADRNLDYSKVLDAIDVAAHNGVRVVGAISDQQPGTESSVAGDFANPGKKP
ncbi:MAG: biopolymer transporter ExbD [Gemmatimonadaceae bacterium]|nr:biopolymer transporter ExbD [Gemmatimonadaceae bacterium]